MDGRISEDTHANRSSRSVDLPDPQARASALVMLRAAMAAKAGGHPNCGKEGLENVVENRVRGRSSMVSFSLPR